MIVHTDRLQIVFLCLIRSDIQFKFIFLKYFDQKLTNQSISSFVALSYFRQLIKTNFIFIPLFKFIFFVQIVLLFALPFDYNSTIIIERICFKH
jgi:hypothetical protein